MIYKGQRAYGFCSSQKSDASGPRVTVMGFPTTSKTGIDGIFYADIKVFGLLAISPDRKAYAVSVGRNRKDTIRLIGDAHSRYDAKLLKRNNAKSTKVKKALLAHTLLPTLGIEKESWGQYCVGKVAKPKSTKELGNTPNRGESSSNSDTRPAVTTPVKEGKVEPALERNIHERVKVSTLGKTITDMIQLNTKTTRKLHQSAADVEQLMSIIANALTLLQQTQDAQASNNEFIE
ncbi:hypothetical protein BOTCAL_1533g00030 [Botryotinia calthae]|uniref:Uncharacterized protein n=1 Tax=Botryotinia calthae TaxID=38488 RepID=A0A4Y8CD92_9HELO|nr:hypothetical protein BOTCAL_1533g00030 [Botryotinia calthae]